MIPDPPVSGWLEKKSGGKEGQSKARMLEKWDRRFFLLSSSKLRYYKSEEEMLKGKPPLGILECSGAELFLKEVKGESFRFTIRSKARDLKLRANSAGEYKKWEDALRLYVASTNLDPSAGGRDTAESLASWEDSSGREASASVASADGAGSSHIGGPPTSGWLEKKSGGKEGQNKSKLLEKWDRRWFLLIGSELRYYKADDDHAKGKPALGAIECRGATVGLKAVKGVTFRFNVSTASRELKLRAASASDYQMWLNALSPLAGTTRHHDSLDESSRPEELPL